MNKIYTLLAALLFSAQLFAQAPERMTYQAVIRDVGNNLIVNSEIGMQISILQGSPTGEVVYLETHTPSTNGSGLVTVEIGGGTITSGAFTSIDWANGPFFVQTETDPEGGINYTITGTSQLLSVPFALHAKTAETVTNITISGNDAAFDNWDKNISDDFSGSYNDLADKPNIADSISIIGFSGNFSDLTNVPGNLDMDATDDFSGSYNDLADKPNIADSISIIGFSGNFNDLTNVPGNLDMDATDDFSGNYSDLINKPGIASTTADGLMSSADKSKLEELQNADGSETKITAGSNISISGSGTSGSPYVINSISQGSGTPTTIMSNTTLTASDQVVFINGPYEATFPASPANGMQVTICSNNSSASINGNGKILYVATQSFPSLTFGDGGVNVYTATYSSELNSWFVGY